MKIESHTIAMRSEHTFSQQATSTFEAELAMLTPAVAEAPVEAVTAEAQEEAVTSEHELMAKIRYMLLTQLLQIFGRGKDRSTGYESLCTTPQEADMPAQDPAKFTAADLEKVRARFMRRVEYTETYEEKECVQVGMQGCVQTADGRQIKLDVDLSMSRSFYSSLDISETVFTDPLVINFDGELPELEEASFQFDIDNDGEKDQISKLSEGSGFLALDKNGNCTIDAGCELFGTAGGNGFAELAAYDGDNNDWIDENDAIFDQLRIWTGEGDESKLIGLGEVGIGAIYLGSTTSEFTYKAESNESLGKLRSTGMFLYEDGRIGNVSQVDFAKHGESGGSGRESAVAKGLKEALAQV